MYNDMIKLFMREIIFFILKILRNENKLYIIIYLFILYLYMYI